MPLAIQELTNPLHASSLSLVAQDPEISLVDLATRFSNPDSAAEPLAGIRWPKGVVYTKHRESKRDFRYNARGVSGSTALFCVGLKRMKNGR